MEKRKFKQFAPKRRWSVKIMSVIVAVFICAISTILPVSAYMFSPLDSPVYAMPLDFIFTVEQKTAGILNHKLVGTLLPPQMDIDIASEHDETVTLETDSGDYYRYTIVSAQSISYDRLRTIFNFLVDGRQWNNYTPDEQHFTITADASVISMGNEVVNLQVSNLSNTTAYYNAFVSFDYKIPGDTTVYHYEQTYNSKQVIGLIPGANALDRVNGDLVYIYNYIAEIDYYGDPHGVGWETYPQATVQSITTTQKEQNTITFMTDNDNILIEEGGGGTSAPVIDNVWLLNSVASFFNFEIFPGFSLGGVMGILFAITVLIAVLKFVAGG